jgi:hypothetical protein
MSLGVKDSISDMERYEGRYFFSEDLRLCVLCRTIDQG